jgi:Bacterial membrane protein N terminal
MRGVPWWGWGVEVSGLAAVVAGAWASGYAQDVLLQAGTVGLFVVPLLVAERAITRALERQNADLAAIRRSDGATDLDEIWRDFGQKLGGRTRPVTLEQLEQELTNAGWVFTKSIGAHRLWELDGQRLALPAASGAGLVPGPIVRLTVRAAGWRHEDWADPH